MHHLEMLSEAETVDESLPALLADVDSAVAVHPSVPFKTLGVWEALSAQRAGERAAACVEADVALQGCCAA